MRTYAAGAAAAGSRTQMAFRTAAARPNKTVPMHSSFAESDRGDIREIGATSPMGASIRARRRGSRPPASPPHTACAALRLRIDRQRVADRHDEGGDHRRKNQDSISFPHYPHLLATRPGFVTAGTSGRPSAAWNDTSSDVPRYSGADIARETRMNRRNPEKPDSARERHFRTRGAGSPRGPARNEFSQMG